MLRSLLVKTLLVAGLVASTASAQTNGGDLPPFDARVQNPALRGAALSARTLAQQASAQSAAARLIDEVQGLKISFDESLGTPRFIRSTARLLTGPDPALDPLDVISRYIAENEALFQISPAMLSTTRITRDYVTQHNGVRHLTLQQVLDGLDVYGAELRANFTSDGALINISSTLVSPTSINSGTGMLSAEEAIVSASTHIGRSPTQGLTRIASRGDEWIRFAATSDFKGSPMARLVLFPMSATSVRHAWIAEIPELGPGNLYECIVDAEDGSLLYRWNRTAYAAQTSAASYRVYTSDSPSPFSPGHDTPLTSQPSITARTVETLISLDAMASPDGWVDPAFNVTFGNNVAAATDTNADNLPDLPRPSGGAGLNFDFPMDFAFAPVFYAAASVTQLFYWNNVIHDRLYQLGFDEASGNFQNNNFGRGGVGGDWLLADAQDGSGTNNANMLTPPDGTNPRMQMFVFTGPTPDRDGDFDTEIVIHEYVHGLSNRLHGGLSALQSTGMGEGWSDFYALALLAESGDDPHANYAAGGYATFNLGGLLSNYYSGIRRYPYSTNQLKNPLTLADIDPTQMNLPGGVPISPIFGDGTPADEVHNQGEVWCVTLWDCRANLIDRLGFAGNELMLQLVTDGMKLSPANPTFIEARDAILLADIVNNGGDNLVDLWAGFSGRGMGESASVPPSSTATGVAEAFDTPIVDDLIVIGGARLEAIGAAGGPFTPNSRTYTLRNIGGSPLNWTASSATNWVTFSPNGGSLAAGASVAVLASINSNANGLPADEYAASMIFRNTSSGAFRARTAVLSIAFVTFNLNSSPGWTTQDGWAFGAPLGLGGDPGSGKTGPNVYGYNLAGVYPDNLPVRNLTTTAINCSDFVNTKLKFERWLGVEEGFFDQASILVSANGVSFTTVWQNPISDRVIDSSWTTQTVDISGIADGQATVFIRWAMGPTDFSLTFAGWNIDDVALLGTPANSTTVWVDFAHVGTQNGTPSAPFNTLTDAAAAATAGDTIKIKGDTKTNSSSGTPTISKNVRLEAVNGTVTIGTP